MAESIVQVNSGSGPKLHTWSRTIGANTVEDEAVFPAEYPLASYIAIGAAVSTATANDHLLQLMAGASLNVRIRRITVEQRGTATTAAALTMEIWRLSTAGTGGTAVTPRPMDTSDAASGATAMTLPTAKGTESVLIKPFVITFRQAISGTASPADDAPFEWTQHPGMKPLMIPAGAANGIAIKNTSAAAAATAIVTIEFVESSFS